MACRIKSVTGIAGRSENQRRDLFSVNPRRDRCQPACFPGAAESLALDCEKASVLLQSGVLTIYWRDGRTEQFGEEAKTGGGADPMAFPFDWHKSLIADFADAIEQDRQPLANGRQTLAVHELIEAIEASSRQGRRIKVNSHTGRSNRSSELPIS